MQCISHKRLSIAFDFNAECLIGKSAGSSPLENETVRVHGNHNVECRCHNNNSSDGVSSRSSLSLCSRDSLFHGGKKKIKIKNYPSSPEPPEFNRQNVFAVTIHVFPKYLRLGNGDRMRKTCQPSVPHGAAVDTS